jgi:hypothetical protein
LINKFGWPQTHDSLAPPPSFKLSFEINYTVEVISKVLIFVTEKHKTAFTK